MKSYIFILSCLLYLISSSTSHASEASKENSFEARYAYALGYRIGQSLKSQGVRKVDPKNFLDGINDYLNDARPRMTEVEINDALTSYQDYLKNLKKQDWKANQAQAEAFLQQNRDKPTVREMSSGLQYEVIQSADGDRPDSSDTVLVHYQGSFINGEVFDSTLQRDKPAEFQLSEVIRGFSEAITHMDVGEKWRIYVPPSLGYGKRGVSGSIGANELLIYEVELLSIVR